MLRHPLLKTMDGGTFWEARVVFLRMATAREQIAFIRSKCWANMTITVTAEELKELETALATHYHTLDLKLSNSVHLGGPHEGGIQQCIQRQQVGYAVWTLNPYNPIKIEDSLEEFINNLYYKDPAYYGDI